MTIEAIGQVRALRRAGTICLLLSVFQILGVLSVPAFSQTGQRITGMKAWDERIVFAQSPYTFTPINQWGGLSTLADEHSTVFPPGTFKGHPNDYLFFVASKTELQTILQDNFGRRE